MQSNRRSDNFKDQTVYTFALESNRESRREALNLPALNLISEPDEKACRICLNTDGGSETFIHPCKCAGSIKYVHEECLKTWLASLGKDLELSKCELCHTRYEMSFLIKRRCLPKDSCKNGAAHCLFIPILVAVMLMLFIIVYLLANKYFTSNNSAEQQAYTIALALVCFIAGIVIIVLIINSVSQACYAPKLEGWRILSQDFQSEHEADRELTAEELAKLEKMRNRTLVIPSSFRVNGKKVRVPKLRPMMTPVNKGERIVKFSPKFFTPIGKVKPMFRAFEESEEEHGTHSRDESLGRISNVGLLKE
jgi:hypothetical protein